MLNEAFKTLKVALPLIIANLLQMSIATVDTMMAGGQNDGGLTQAAVSLGASLWQICFLGMMGICLPLSPLFAYAYASKDYVGLRRKFASAFRLTFFLGLMAMVAAFFVPSLMQVLDIEADLIEPATGYVRIMALGLPVVALALAPRFLCEGMTNTKIIMYLMMFSIPFNIIGNYVFLNGVFGLPKMGAKGIALSSLISLIMVSGLLFLYVLKSKATSGFRLFKKMPKTSFSFVKELMKLGFPVSLGILMEHGLFATVVLFAGKIGKGTAAANQIALNYTSLMFMIPLGMSMALSARIGAASSKSDLKKIRVIGFSGLFLCLLCMTLSMLVIIIFAPSIASLYSADKAIIALATQLLFFAALFQITDATQVNMSGCLRGLRDTKTPTIFAFVGYWVISIPFAYYLAFTKDKGAAGLWIAMVIGLAITAVLNTWRFIRVTSHTNPLKI